MRYGCNVMIPAETATVEKNEGVGSLETAIVSSPNSPDGKWWQTLVREQPAFALSILYLALGGAGSYYYTALFARFGINIFYYAEVSDFLLVIFREPLVPGLTIAAGLVLYILFRIDSILDSRFPAYKAASGFFQRWMERDPYFGKRGRSQRIWEVLIVLIVILFVRYITPFCVRYAVKDIETSTHRQVLVILNSDNDRRQHGIPNNMRLIGTTGRFIFLYEPIQRQIHIIPVESVARIVISSEQATQQRDLTNLNGNDTP